MKNFFIGLVFAFGLPLFCAEEELSINPAENEKSYQKLIDEAYEEGDFQKMLEYALEEVKLGSHASYYYAGIAADNLGDYEEAMKHFNRAAMKKNELQNEARSKLADLLMHELRRPNNMVRSLYSALDKEGFAKGAYELGISYLYDESDTKEAYKYFLRALRGSPLSGDNTNFLSRASVELGFMWELGEVPGRNANPKNAYDYFKDACENDSPAGCVNMNRLIWTEKFIPAGVKRQQAVSDAVQEFKKYASTNNQAAFLYGAALIARGDEDVAVRAFENIDVSKMQDFPLAALQLGIAYYFGSGVEKDEEKANIYFDMVQRIENGYRSAFFAQGYLSYLGLGGEQKDEQKGLTLMLEAKQEHDDIWIPIEVMFPMIKQVLEKYETEKKKRQHDIGDQLIEEEGAEKAQQHKSGRKKKAGKKKHPSSSVPIEERASSSTETFLAEPVEQPSEKNIDWRVLLGEVKTWNDWFAVEDGSKVEAINYDKHTITIDDPARGEKILFFVARDLNKKYRAIPPFTYHKRIALRQSDAVSKATADNHSFAQMLDYVMQELGTLVPFLSAGGAINDSLVADVIRINNHMKKELACHAEYTFGKKDGQVYVYHRLLRPYPQNKQKAILDKAR